MLINGISLSGNLLAYLIALIIEKKHVDEMIRILELCLTEVSI